MAFHEKLFLWLNEHCVGPFTYQEVSDRYLAGLPGDITSSTLYSPDDGSGLWEPLEKLFPIGYGPKYLDWKDRCATHYNADASRYDGEFLVKLLRRPELSAFLTLLPVLPAGGRVLDFGCGTGRQTFELAARGFKVDAFDAAPGMRAVLGRKLAASTPPVQNSVKVIAREAEIGKNAYAFVCSIGVMDYYPEPAQLLEPCGQAIEAGGYLMVSFPDRASPMAWLYGAGSYFVCRAFLHSHGSVCQAAKKLGLRPVAAHRSPFNFALGGMLSFILFVKPTRLDVRLS